MFPLWVIILAIALRLIVLPLLSTNFSSDMADIHAFAVDVASGQPFANLHNYQGIPRASHLNMTGLVMSVIYRIVCQLCYAQNVYGGPCCSHCLVDLPGWQPACRSAGRVYCSQHFGTFHPWFVTAGFYRANIFRSRLWS